MVVLRARGERVPQGANLSITTAYLAATVTRAGGGHGTIPWQGPDVPCALSKQQVHARGFAVLVEGTR